MGIITPERYVLSMRKTPVLLKAVLKGVTQDQAVQCTDGPDGWSVVETMCHMRDFGDISLTRARLTLSEDQPHLPNLDPTETAKQRDYKHQILAAEFAAYLDARKTLLSVLSGATEADWARQGTHAKFGPMTLLEQLVFIEWHDMNHLEQIARSLNLSEALF
jgi:hypothetical protein